MSKVIYVIPEEQRRLFDEQWEIILPNDFKKGFEYTATWSSESPFPNFNKDFLTELPTEYRLKLKELYKKIISN